MTKVTPQTTEKQSLPADVASSEALPAYEANMGQTTIAEDPPLVEPAEQQQSHHHHHRRHSRHHRHHPTENEDGEFAFRETLPHRGPPPPGAFPHIGPHDQPDGAHWGRRWHPFEGYRGRGRGGCRGGFGRGGAHRGRWGHGGVGRGGWFGGPWIAPFMQGLDALRQLDEDVNGDHEKADFVPALDSFESDTAYTLHIELPGAKKTDLGVHWDEEARHLRVSGVVHRPGDEEFLKTLSNEERQVGVFQRDIQFEKAIEPSDISAKLEDGLLAVIVPKAEEKEKKIEIQTVQVN